MLIQLNDSLAGESPREMFQCFDDEWPHFDSVAIECWCGISRFICVQKLLSHSSGRGRWREGGREGGKVGGGQEEEWGSCREWQHKRRRMGKKPEEKISVWHKVYNRLMATGGWGVGEEVEVGRRLSSKDHNPPLINWLPVKESMAESGHKSLNMWTHERPSPFLGLFSSSSLFSRFV